MSVLVVGLSHKSAPVATLDQAAVSSDTLAKLLADLAHAEPVAESFVISTCNRVEVYADVDRFHAGVTAICELLARHWGMPPRELTQYLYVHYEDRAVGHLLAVACGWTRWWWAISRSSARYARRSGWPPSMAPSAGFWGTGRLALRTGKRARAETGIGRTGVSLLSLAIEAASPSLPASAPDGTAPGVPSLAGRDVLVVGAGSMSALAATTACRDGARSLRGGQPDAPTRREAGRQVGPGRDPGHRTRRPARRYDGGGHRPSRLVGQVLGRVHCLNG